MENTDLKQQIIEVLRDPRLGLQLLENEDAIGDWFLSYIRLWEKWNGKMNLTAETDPLEFLQRHVFVSLQFARVLAGRERVLDIGSGAGLPGVPLKILWPELNLVLVESQRKRASFLATVVRVLGLKGARVENVRAEDLDSAWRGGFDAVLFRAVSDTPACLKLAEPWLKPGGRAVLLKAQKNTAEPLAHPYFAAPRSTPVEDYQGQKIQLVEYHLAG